MMTELLRTRALLGISGMLCALAAASGNAQSISGSARDSANRLALPAVEVSLLDSAGRAVAHARTSELGVYRVSVPAPGRYRMTARRLGFRSSISPWLLVSAGEATTFDFVLDLAPQELGAVETRAQGDPVQIGRRFGLDPKNINAFVVSPDKVQEYRRTSSQLADIIRQIGIPGGVAVREEDSGEPCIVLVGRDRHCMLILVDNIVTPHVRDLDLSTIEDIIVMRPNEAGLWFGSLSADDGGVNNPNQRSTMGGVLLIRTKMGVAKE